MDKIKFVEILLVFGIIVLLGLNYYNPKQEYKPQNVTIAENESEKYHMKVFGTEYLYGEVATTFLQLLNENYDPVYNATCWINVYYPNNSIFIDDALMAKFEEGLYYYDYVVPNISGIYMLTTRCFIPTLHHKLLAQDFGTLTSVSQEGTWYNTHEVDNTYHMLHSNNYWLDVYYNMSNTVNTSNITDVQVVMFYKMDWCTNCLRMYIYDFVDSTWKLLPNRGSGSGIWASSPELILSNPVDGGDLDRYMDDNGVMMVRLRTPEYRLYVDYIGIEIIAGATQYTNLIALRGSGEVHVHEPPQAELNVSGVNVSAEVEWPPEIRWAS